MSKHFSLDCDPAELTAAETKLGLLHDHLQHEAGRLVSLCADSSGWTGAAASACLGETATISATMTKDAPMMVAAGEAVRTFRMALETAQGTTLPRLNSRWEQSESDFRTDTAKAGSAYANEVHSYRNVPDEDAGPARAAALGVRKRALGDASVQQAGAQRGLSAEYDAMVLVLEQAARACGAALAGAVPITFSSDQWAAVKGGHIPMGMLASLRSQVFGGDSFVRQSDGVKAGEYVAGKLDSQARNGEPGDPLDPEVVALMDRLKGDPAFTEALLTDLGPGGAAFLSMQARGLYESTGGGAGKEQGRQLLRILTEVYATGSKVQVTTDNGQSRPLMDQEWLDNFNPASYDAAGDWYRGFFSLPTYVHGYRPDLLLPFMNKKGAFSCDFSQMVTQQAMEDYESAMDLDKADQDVVNRWGLYSGADAPPIGSSMAAVMTGDSSNPFRTELFHIALDRTAEHPFASNAAMMTHRDTMVQLMTGKADWLTGGEGSHDWASAALASILKQATVGSQASNMVSADAALWGVGDYLNKHPDDHLVKNVQIALGDVVTDKRFMNGAMSSVTSPFGQEEGVRDDPTHPEMGPLMNEKLWAALHQEAMRQSKTAAKIIAEVGTHINDKRTVADLGISWDHSAEGGKGAWVNDRNLKSMDMYQAEAARHFLGTNLKDIRDAIMADLERELAENGQQREKAKDILGTMVGWATDPASIVGDVSGRLTDFAVDSAVNWAMPTEGINDRYAVQLKAQDTMLAAHVDESDFWSTIGNGGDTLIAQIMADKVSTKVEAPQQGMDDPTQAAPSIYDGDPRTYVGRVSYPLPGVVGQQTDDFLEYGQDGVPTGHKPFGEMNAHQREAYLKWLHDPAVQKYLGDLYSSVENARGSSEQ